MNNYQNNRDKLLKNQKEYYHNRISQMTKDELKTFREKRSIYFKKWYEKNRKKTYTKIIEDNKQVVEYDNKILNGDYTMRFD